MPRGYPEYVFLGIWQRFVAYPAGYPHGPSTIHMVSHLFALPQQYLATTRCHTPLKSYSVSHKDTFAKGLLKNEFSLGTLQAGRVPTWSLYNTHEGAPLCLAPFLSYTGVIPLLNHNQKTPNLQTFVPTVFLKTSFPRIPTYPAAYPHDPSTPMGSHPCALPQSPATKRCCTPQKTYSRSNQDTFAKCLPKTKFSLGTHQAGRVPT